MYPILFRHPPTPGLVSVIIPTRNGEKYIGDALDSVAQQSHENWEVIIVEDGSYGETEAIVRRFANLHPDHRVHYQRNETAGGAAYTRNVCFGLAAGEWIAFLDCDDRWMPEHLKSCVNALVESGDDIAYSATAMCVDKTDRVLGICGPTSKELRLFPQSLLGRGFVTPSATVVRRDVIRDVGAWNTNCRYCEDAEFFLRAARIGKKFRLVGGVHCLYRKEHEGATTQKLAATLEEFATIADWFADMPNGEPLNSIRMIAGSFSLAGKQHALGSSKDPSVTRSRAAPLYFQAWKKRPARFGYLLKTIGYALRFGWSKNDQLPSRPEYDIDHSKQQLLQAA